MGNKKSKYQATQKKAEATLKKTNEKINELGVNANSLYEKLSDIQGLFDAIRNVPSETKFHYEQIKEVRLNWKQQADKIESDFKEAAVKNAGGGAAVAGAGVAVMALGPTAAMGIATTFGVASTGTAISALSGAAATNAALAWLGGGALAAGGGGMAAGEAFLAMAGPIGWAIAGVAVVGSGLALWKSKNDKHRLEDIYTLIANRDIKSYELAIVELNERISRIQNETVFLDGAIEKIQSFGTDYEKMTEDQQYELGFFVNRMDSSTQLLVNPILGLLPKYSKEDFNQFISDSSNKKWSAHLKSHETALITLSNLLYKIELGDKDRKLLIKSFKKNKEALSAMKIQKEDVNDVLFDFMDKCLKYKYSHSRKN